MLKKIPASTLLMDTSIGGDEFDKKYHKKTINIAIKIGEILI